VSVYQRPLKSLLEQLAHTGTSMNFLGRRWMLLLLLWGGQRLETSEIKVLDRMFPGPKWKAAKALD
jgi:hypothetical protein